MSSHGNTSNVRLSVATAATSWSWNHIVESMVTPEPLLYASMSCSGAATTGQAGNRRTARWATRE